MAGSWRVTVTTSSHPIWQLYGRALGSFRLRDTGRDHPDRNARPQYREKTIPDRRILAYRAAFLNFLHSPHGGLDASKRIFDLLFTTEAKETLMSRNWLIEGQYIEYCSCDLGCPCESMADPTYGHCTGLVGFKIDSGHCDDVDLSGLKVVATFAFPRAIHHGQGVMHPIIDERASEAQREALFYILSGADQPAGTMFQIFSVIVDTIRDPLFAPITFDWDLTKRQARIEVPSAVRAHSEPIRNPVTDTEHQILTVLPNGWVFHEAETVAGFAKSLGPIRFDLNRRHSSMAHVAWGPKGLVHSYDEYKQKFGRP